MSFHLAVNVGRIKIKVDIIVYIILGIALLLCTITDLKYQEIYLSVIVADMVLLIGYHIWQNSFLAVDIIGVIAVGVVFGIICIASGNKIGSGDVLLFMLTGLGLGVYANIFIIMISFFCAFFAAIFLVTVRHKTKNYRMPLAPFVLCSFAVYSINLIL